MRKYGNGAVPPSVRVLVLSRSRPDGIMARRARALAEHAPGGVEVAVAHRPLTPRPFLTGERPDVAYVFDSHPAELRAAAALRARGVPVVLEAGDVGWVLERAKGASRGSVMTRELLERASWRFADGLTVRGEGFRDVLRDLGVAREATVIPDGVDLDAFAPGDPRPGRRRLGLTDDDVAVGVLGSIVWVERAQTAYGWELVEALPRLPARVKAVIVGDGTGLVRLRARAGELGVADRLLTPGAVPHADVPGILAALDAVVWTQTPDVVGRCRTTMKLPEYLACGSFVIASDVGEARRSVDGNGVRVAYRGGRDPAYVDGVTGAVAGVAADPGAARERGLLGRAHAERFGWERVAATWADVVRACA